MARRIDPEQRHDPEGRIPAHCGVGSALECAFKATHGPTRSLETTHDQIAARADIPASTQLLLLKSVITVE